MTDTAEKYRDKLDPDHKMAMDMAIRAYATVKMVEAQLRKVHDAERQSHSIGHIVDPTLYRDQINSKSFADQMKIINAALSFIAAMDEVFPVMKGAMLTNG